MPYWLLVEYIGPQTDQLLDEAKGLQLQIRALPRRVRDWGVYKAVDEKVVNMSAVLPLVGTVVTTTHSVGCSAMSLRKNFPFCLAALSPEILAHFDISCREYLGWSIPDAQGLDCCSFINVLRPSIAFE